jgi:esterase/lipase superfamily enzyme
MLLLASPVIRILGQSIAWACLLAISVTASGQDLRLVQPYQLYNAARVAGNYKEAARHGHDMLAAAEARYGTSSNELVDAIERLAEVLVLAGELDEAERQYSRALSLKEDALGDLHPELVPALDALAGIAMAQRRHADAEALLWRIFDTEEAVYGENSMHVVITLKRLRELFDQQGRTADVADIDALIEELESVERDPGFGGLRGERRYEAENGYATVRVFYGTNRARSGDPKPAAFYSGDRGELEVGYLDVSVPETHKYGELETESQWSIHPYILGEEGRKQRYVLLVDLKPLGTTEFQGKLRENIDSSPSRDVFVFVHGFNLSFEDAARRAAQLAYDIDFDGTPMMYSWPSQGSTAAYTVDEAVVRLSGRKMSRFLEDIVMESGADRIHLIAHSMGNRALIEALQSYATRRSPDRGQRPFDQVVFTAPDVDRDYFVEVFDGIQNMAERITLYASNNDIALQSSSLLHGAPRAGQTGEQIVTHAKLDSIDMSGVEADVLGHTYFAANQGVILDLFSLFWRGEAPSQRCGMVSDQGGSGAWAFDARACEGADRRHANVLLKRFGPTVLSVVEKRLAATADADDESSRQEWTQILDRLNEMLAGIEEP